MRILLADFHHLGDLVLSWPFQQGALAAGHTLHVACRMSAAGLQKLAFPQVPVLPWSPPWHEESAQQAGGTVLRQWWALWTFARKLRQQHFDAGVCAWADPRVAVLFHMAGLPRRIGLPVTAANLYAANRPHRRDLLKRGQCFERWARRCGWPLWSEPLQRPGDGTHQLEIWQSAAQRLQFSTTRETPWLAWSATDSTPLRSGDALDSALMASDQKPGEVPKAANAKPQKTLLIHPGARLATKRWSMDHFLSVARGFLSRQSSWKVEWVLGPDDDPLPAACAEHGSVTRLDTFPPLLEKIHAASFVLAHDSLAAHLAAALGRPVLAIFGSGDPIWFAPGGDQNNVIHSSACPYCPCLDVCLQPSLLCLETLEVSAVLEKLEARIALAGG